MKKLKDPRLLLILSMTVFGTIGLFVRSINLPSGEIALYRAVLASMLLGIYLLVTKQKIPFLEDFAALEDDLSDTVDTNFLG